MKTILIERPRQSEAEFILTKESNDHVQEIGGAILLVAVLLIACMFIEPLIVFAIAAILCVSIVTVRTYKELSQLKYDFGNDLLDYTSIKEFRESYER